MNVANNSTRGMNPQVQKDTQKLVNDIHNGLNKVVDNIAKDLKENTLTYAAVIGGGVFDLIE